MVGVLILLILVVLALLAVWLSLKILLLLLPYLCVAAAIWFIWRHRGWIAGQFRGP